ncbi:MAG: PAS domain-containing protein [Candidatus Omnitrophica bacterium]|nr:PAS domain-containing protein [Candidatus Omnitrophota bacterium]
MAFGKDAKRDDIAVEEWNVIFDAIDDAIFVADIDNNIRKANRSFAKLYDIAPEKLIGKKCYELVHKMDKPWPLCPFEKTKLDKKTHVERVDDPNIGFPVLVTTSPIFDRDGKLAGIVHIAKNISDYAKAQEDLEKEKKALEESETKYRAIYDSSTDAVMLLEPGDGFIGGNRAAIRMFGCKDEAEFVSHTPADFSPEYQPDGALSSAKSVEMTDIAAKNGSHFFEWKHKRINGEEFDASVLLIRMELGGEIILQATVRDISGQKKNEAELKKKVDELERFIKVTVGRELRMKELKAKIARLESKLGIK